MTFPNAEDIPEKCLALDGFERIHRHWDPKLNAYVAKVLPGESYVTTHHEWIMTTLGSCIAVCLRDKETHVGGLNHFLLPDSRSGVDKLDDSAQRYGNWAMEYLINAILKNHGKRRNLEAKIFGGSEFSNSVSAVGKKNIEFIKSYLYDENIKLLKESVGGDTSRTVMYHPNTGRVLLKSISMSDSQLEAEKRYVQSVKSREEADDAGEIDLF